MGETDRERRFEPNPDPLRVVEHRIGEVPPDPVSDKEKRALEQQARERAARRGEISTVEALEQIARASSKWEQLLAERTLPRARAEAEELDVLRSGRPWYHEMQAQLTTQAEELEGYGLVIKEMQEKNLEYHAQLAKQAALIEACEGLRKHVGVSDTCVSRVIGALDALTTDTGESLGVERG